MKVSLVAVTQPVQALQDRGILTAEDLLVHNARVSSPERQDRPETGRNLLRYCWEHGHVSVFEQADLTVQVDTSRAISDQILRHWSLYPQEWSQRYSDPSVLGFEPVNPRRQDPKNRQNSTDDLPEDVKRGFLEILHTLETAAMVSYQAALALGVAKESARFLLPMSIGTRMYLKACVRDWIFYIKKRTEDGTQQEHKELAEAIREVFVGVFPVTSEILGWTP